MEWDIELIFINKVSVMDELKKFIKTLNILYVEDEKNAREILSKILKRYFNNVKVCENGLEGYITFQKEHMDDKTFDLIISDINMPKMDGLDMLEKIRELNTDVPIIFITARNEANVMIRAIELQVTNYIIKPLDMDAINNVINNTCEKIYLKNMFIKKQRELEIYIKMVDQIALIAKLDTNGNIKYLNENYKNTLGIRNSDYINKSYESLKSSQSNPQTYNQIFEVINKGNIWEGILKNESISGELIYEKSTIMPIFDESNKKILEYICVNYPITKQEKEKKELNKKMIQNIVQHKKDTYSTAKEIEQYESEILKLKKHILQIESKLKAQNNNRLYLLNQLESYERSKLNQSTGKVDIVKNKNLEIDKLLSLIKKFKREKNNYEKMQNDLNKTILHLNNQLELYKNNESKLKLRIKDLNDLNNNLNKEFSEKKEKKGLFK